MRGDFLHNQVLVEPLARGFGKLGANVFREYPIWRGQHPRFVDLYIEYGSRRIVCEAEQAPRRVAIARDVIKALSVRADLLLVIVPTCPLAAKARRYLSQFLKDGKISKTQVLVLTLGAALQMLKNKGHLMSLLNVTLTLIPKIPAIVSDQPPGGSNEEKTKL